jgi:transposase
MIALTENFTTFSNARQFACYAGIAPFPNQSGIRKGKRRVNKMANKKIKALLSLGAISACSYDKQMKAYRQRKLEEGKSKLVVLNNVKNKLVHRMFAVIKRQSPFVELNTYA